MGNSSSQDSQSQELTGRVTAKIGAIPLSGRYHRAPNQYEDSYKTTTRVLGTGIAGSVMLAKRKGTEEKFAVKTFDLTNARQDKMKQLQAEVEIYLIMDHPHVTRLFDVYETKSRLHLVMECMQGGELFERVTKLKKFSENDAADVTHQMLLAVNYIHNHGIVHRDLKLENFLYEKQGSNHLKLIDFGFSKVWDPNIKMKVSCGTLSYVAPEVLKKAYTSKCDLWSLGVVVFILLAGYMPFAGDEATQMKNIAQGNCKFKPDKWKNVSKEALNFVKALLQVDAEKRLSAPEALVHNFIAQRNTAKNSTVDSSVADGLIQFSQASKFRRHCLEMMAWSLTSDERAKVREDFLKMDEDKQGTISLQEMKKVIEASYDIADAEVNKIFDALDTNNDDEIHYSDFLAAMVSTRIVMHDDMLRAAFDKFDTDHSGYITVGNMHEVLGETCNENQISSLLAEADQLKDGRVSYAEFVSYLRGDALESQLIAAEGIVDNEMKKGMKKIPSMKPKQEGPRKSPKESLQLEDAERKKNCCMVM